MADFKTSVIIDLTGNLTTRAKQYGRAIGDFSGRGQRDLKMLTRSADTLGKTLDRMAGRTTGIIAGAGTAYVATRQVMESAKLDKQLIQIQQTAGATTEQAAALRKELFLMALQTGQSLESLLGGFNNLIQAGQSWEQSLATVKAINPAMAVTGSQAEVLSSALTVAAEAFDFDLSQVEIATDLLDRMTYAGRLGNAELEDLSGIFARVGVNAKSAGFDLNQTLGLIEQLSLVERNPERLATLVDSTMRIFTNQKYLDKAASATGVSFYNADGGRRGALDVLDDIAARYQRLNSDIDRDQALSAAFGEVDLDTLRGLRVLLNEGTLNSAREMSVQISQAGGTIAHDLPGALENAVDQAARLKSVLKEAADGFAQPINQTIQDGIKYLLDDLGLSGGELLAGGAAGILGGGLLMKGSGKLLQRLGGLGAGAGTGKALEQIGIQPVYVVNMGEGMGGLESLIKGKGPFNPAGPVSSPGRFGSAVASAGRFALTRGTPLAAAGAAGYGIGTLINDNFVDGTEFGHSVGKLTATILAALGNDTARAALAADPDNEYTPGGNRRAQRSGRIKIDVSDTRVHVNSVQSDNMDLDVSGSNMVMP